MSRKNGMEKTIPEENTFLVCGVVAQGNPEEPAPA
jgi:hypothetical protein